MKPMTCFAVAVVFACAHAPTPRSLSTDAGTAPRQTTRDKPDEGPDLVLPGVDRPYAEALAQGQASSRPILFYFGASWCAPCKLLKHEMLRPAPIEVIKSFVFQPYDAEVGHGVEAAAHFAISAFPTLVAVASDGTEVMRSRGPPKELETWLMQAAVRSALDPKVVAARLQADPKNVELLWAAYERARSKDRVAARALLARIEEVDPKADSRAIAAESWNLARAEIQDGMVRAVHDQAFDFLARYPEHGLRAGWMLAATGAEKRDVEDAFGKVVAACPSPNPGRTDCDDLRVVVYVALAAGAPRAAHAAAEKLVADHAHDAFAHLALAESANHLGLRAEAIAEGTRARELALDGGHAALAKGIGEDVARFERGQPHPDLPTPNMGSLMRFSVVGSPKVPRSPEVAAMLAFARSHRAIVSACLDVSGAMSEAYLRIRVGKGPKADKVEVLEPDARPRLRACLEAEAAKVEFPPEATNAVVPVTVVFRSQPRAFLHNCGRHPAFSLLEAE